MHRHRPSWLVASALAWLPWYAGRAEAQYGRTYHRGYPGYGNGYNINNGLQGGYRGPGRFAVRPPVPSAPLTYNNLGGLAQIITQVPGWNRTTGQQRPRPRPLPTVPRDQLLTSDGKILWPGATPEDAAVSGTRKPAEEAVRDVVDAGRVSGHATVRQVVDAKVKLAAFSRLALPIVKAKNAADSAALERFIVELEKTLQTIADRY